MDAESVLRVKGLGDAGRNRGAPGDLYITFAVKPRAGIQRRGLDLYSDVRLNPAHVVCRRTPSSTTCHSYFHVDSSRHACV